MDTKIIAQTIPLVNLFYQSFFHIFYIFAIFSVQTCITPHKSDPLEGRGGRICVPAVQAEEVVSFFCGRAAASTAAVSADVSAEGCEGKTCGDRR